MPYSFWKDSRGFEAVSKNQNSPGPVVGYLIPQEGGWIIEGDDEAILYGSREAAAKIVLDRDASC